MAGTPTPRLLLPLPAETDPADVPLDLSKLATALDSGGSGSIPGGVAYDNQGTFAQRPAAGVRGRYYFTTDNGVLYRDTGAAWIPIIPAVTPTLPAKPIVGQEAYWAIVDPYTSVYALWHMRCASAGLWGCVGGPPIYSLNLTGYNSFNSSAWCGMTPATYTPQYAGYYDVTVGMSANFSGVAETTARLALLSMTLRPGQPFVAGYGGQRERVQRWRRVDGSERTHVITA